MYKYVCLRVDISMTTMCTSSDIKRYDDRRTPELSDAPLHNTQDTTSIEKKTFNPKLILILTCITLVGSHSFHCSSSSPMYFPKAFFPHAHSEGLDMGAKADTDLNISWFFRAICKEVGLRVTIIMMMCDRRR